MLGTMASEDRARNVRRRKNCVRDMGDKSLNEIHAFHENKSLSDVQRGNENEMFPRVNKAVLSSMVKHKRRQSMMQ